MARCLMAVELQLYKVRNFWRLLYNRAVGVTLLNRMCKNGQDGKIYVCVCVCVCVYLAATSAYGCFQARDPTCAKLLQRQ